MRFLVSCKNSAECRPHDALGIGRLHQFGFSRASRGYLGLFDRINNPSLVNLAIPPTEDFDFTTGLLHNNSRFGRVAADEANLLRKLKHRFDNSPLNKLCYYHSYHSSEDSMVQTLNVDMLLAVMKGGRLDHIIDGRDSFGSTSMDYLSLNRLPTSGDVIQRVLQKRFEQLLGLDRSWKSNMCQAVDEALTGNWRSRRREIVVVYLQLAKYERQENLSLLELCLWKTKIDEVTAKEEATDREFCRIDSGASIVIPQVQAFLDNLDMEDRCL